MVARLCKFTKDHSIVHLMNFTVCKLNLSKAVKKQQMLVMDVMRVYKLGGHPLRGPPMVNLTSPYYWRKSLSGVPPAGTRNPMDLSRASPHS